MTADRYVHDGACEHAHLAPLAHLLGVGALKWRLPGVQVLELQHPNAPQRCYSVVRSLRGDHQLRGTKRHRLAQQAWAAPANAAGPQPHLHQLHGLAAP